MLEHTVLGIHCGFPKLLGVHLTETFISLEHHTVAVAVAMLVDETLHLLLIPCIFLHFLFTLGAALVKRRSGYVKITIVDNRANLTVEESHKKGGDMGAVDIGIGHDYDLVITELAHVWLL